MENIVEYTPNPDRYVNMPSRRCGLSGIVLPEVSLGLWHNFGEEREFSESQKMLHYAFDKGIVHFDLANNYGVPYGSAEVAFGKMVKQSLFPYRDEMFISTKAGHEMWAGHYGNWGSRKSLMASLDQSLKRMNLDYVDVFYSHRYDPETPLEETLQTLVDIVRQGKALYVGISKYPTQIAQLAYKYLAENNVRCLLYQGKYNILYQDPETAGLLEQAKKNGVGFIAFSPLAQGLLTDKYLGGNVSQDSRMAQNAFLKRDILTPEMLEKLAGLNEIAERRGQTLAQMALSWVLRKSAVSSVIIGASSTRQIDDNLKALENKVFGIDELFKINEIVNE